MDKTNRSHMETLRRLGLADPGLILATPFLEIDLGDTVAVEAACQWWEKLTADAGEGMVVKPLDFVARGSKGVAQPALKCRSGNTLALSMGRIHGGRPAGKRTRGSTFIESRWSRLGLFSLTAHSVFQPETASD